MIDAVLNETGPRAGLPPLSMPRCISSIPPIATAAVVATGLIAFATTGCAPTTPGGARADANVAVVAPQPVYQTKPSPWPLELPQHLRDTHAERLQIHYSDDGFRVTNLAGVPSNALHAVLQVREKDDGTRTCDWLNWRGNGQILFDKRVSGRRLRFETVFVDNLVDSTRTAVWSSGAFIHVVYIEPGSDARRCVVDVDAPGSTNIKVAVLGNRHTRYAGLQFLTTAVVSITEGGVLETDREGISALDPNDRVWISKYLQRDERSAFVFVQK